MIDKNILLPCDTVEACNQYYAKEDRLYCFNDISENGYDVTVCDKIEQASLAERYAEIAIARNDIAICYNIKEGGQRYICVSKVTGDQQGWL